MSELFDFRGTVGCEIVSVDYADWKNGLIILRHDMKRGDGVELRQNVEYSDMKTVVYTGFDQISHDCNLTSFVLPSPPRIFNVLYRGRCKVETLGKGYIERIFTNNFMLTNEIDYNFATTIDRKLTKKLIVIDGVGKWFVEAVPGRKSGHIAYSISSIKPQTNPFPFYLKHDPFGVVYSRNDLDTIPEFSRDLSRIGKTLTIFREGLVY
jgi:hypothetical protein